MKWWVILHEIFAMGEISLRRYNDQRFPIKRYVANEMFEDINGKLKLSIVARMYFYWRHLGMV